MVCMCVCVCDWEYWDGGSLLYFGREGTMTCVWVCVCVIWYSQRRTFYYTLWGRGTGTTCCTLIFYLFVCVNAALYNVGICRTHVVGLYCIHIWVCVISVCLWRSILSPLHILCACVCLCTCVCLLSIVYMCVSVHRCISFSIFVYIPCVNRASIPP